MQLQFQIFQKTLAIISFSVAVHCFFFRVRKLIAKTSSNIACIIQWKDVSFTGHSSVEFILRHSKTMHNTYPRNISLSKVSPHKFAQPVTTLQLYICPLTNTQLDPYFNFIQVHISYQFMSTDLQNL